MRVAGLLCLSLVVVACYASHADTELELKRLATSCCMNKCGESQMVQLSTLLSMYQQSGTVDADTMTFVHEVISGSAACKDKMMKRAERKQARDVTTAEVYITCPFYVDPNAGFYCDVTVYSSDPIQYVQIYNNGSSQNQQPFDCRDCENYLGYNTTYSVGFSPYFQSYYQYASTITFFIVNVFDRNWAVTGRAVTYAYISSYPTSAPTHRPATTSSTYNGTTSSTTSSTYNGTTSSTTSSSYNGTTSGRGTSTTGSSTTGGGSVNSTIYSINCAQNGAYIYCMAYIRSDQLVTNVENYAYTSYYQYLNCYGTCSSSPYAYEIYSYFSFDASYYSSAYVTVYGRAYTYNGNTLYNTTTVYLTPAVLNITSYAAPATTQLTADSGVNFAATLAYESSEGLYYADVVYRNVNYWYATFSARAYAYNSNSSSNSSNPTLPVYFNTSNTGLYVGTYCPEVTLYDNRGSQAFFRLNECIIVEPFVEICPTGYYISSTSSTGCRPCAQGYYAPVANSQVCSACPAGSTSSCVLGSDSCKQCNPGTASVDGICKVCPVGTYASWYGSAVCAPCACNTYTNTTGSRSCTSCPPGTFSTEGASKCSRCPAGKISYGGSGCIACASGSVPAAGGYYCDRCPANTYAKQGATTCTPCLAGQKSAEGSFSCSVAK